MALVTCKECGKEVSNKAKTCPSCGAKAPKKTSLLTWLVLILILLGVYSSFDTTAPSDKADAKANSKIKDSNVSKGTTEQSSKAEPKEQLPVWRTNTSKDEMTGELKAFAHSPIAYPKKRMSFPYSDVTTWMGVGCDGSNEWAYFGFSDSPNITNDENKDGYSIIKTRLKWDEQIEDATLTQDWGDKFLNLRNDAYIISKIETSDSVMLELKWHGEQSVHFEYSLRGSKKAITDIRSMCGNK